MATRPFLATLGGVALFMALSSVALEAQQYTYTTIDVPGASATFATGINDKGDIVGSYSDPESGQQRGFVIFGGTLTKLDCPQAPSTWRAINNQRQIVGYYLDSQNNSHGLLTENSSCLQIDYPGTNVTVVNSINDRGVVLGDYVQGDNIAPCFELKNGVFSSSNASGSFNRCNGINNDGYVTGYYGGGVCFLLRDGRFTTCDIPGFQFNFPNGINNISQVVGMTGGTGGNHGYMADIGVITQIEPPGATASEASGINLKGVIVGNYTASDGTIHGYTATPSN
jgi:hypothetical protein